MAKVQVENSFKNNSRIKDMLTGVLGVCISRKYEMEKTLRLMAAVMKVADFDGYPNICTRKQVSSEVKKIVLAELYNKRNGYLSR